MAYKQPGAGKDLLLFLLVDVLVDKELTADKAVLQVDQGFAIRGDLGNPGVPPIVKDGSLVARTASVSPRLMRARNSSRVRGKNKASLTQICGLRASAGVGITL